METVRKSLGIPRKDGIQNEEVRRRKGIEERINNINWRKLLIWYGHVQSIGDARIPKGEMAGISQKKGKERDQRKQWKRV